MDTDHIIDQISANMDWQDRVKEFFGFGAHCMNGGRKSSGICRCGKYFAGRLCEYIICLNGGTPTDNNGSCLCPDSHIRGRFCETINCENGGQDNGDGYCRCPYDWYSGRYCETYSTPWNIVLGVTITLIIFLIVMFFICRLDICQASCCKYGDSEENEDTEAGVGGRLNRQFSWRRRDRNLRQGSERRSAGGRRRLSDDRPVTEGTNVTLLYIPREVTKPPDYSPEEAPPPYEAVVRSLPPPPRRSVDSDPM